MGKMSVSNVDALSQVGALYVANAQAGATAKDAAQAISQKGVDLQNNLNALSGVAQLSVSIAEAIGKSIPDAGLYAAALSLANNLQQIARQIENNQPISEALVLQAASDISSIAGGEALLVAAAAGSGIAATVGIGLVLASAGLTIAAMAAGDQASSAPIQAAIQGTYGVLKDGLLSIPQYPDKVRQSLDELGALPREVDPSREAPMFPALPKNWQPRPRYPLQGPNTKYRDPLAIDLDGDGVIRTSSNKTNGVFFDHDGNGFAESTGWISAQDGLVVWDRNGNGRIDSGSELFGDNSLLRSGAKASGGLQALSEWDSNKDGRIDEADVHFGDLRIWRDVNQDGVSQVNELKTFSEAGIASFSLAFDVTNEGPDASGNSKVRVGSFTRVDGSSGLAGEIALRRDTALSVSVSSFTTSEAIAALPNLSGYGNLLDLHQELAKEDVAIVAAGGKG